MLAVLIMLKRQIQVFENPSFLLVLTTHVLWVMIFEEEYIHKFKIMSQSMNYQNGDIASISSTHLCLF